MYMYIYIYVCVPETVEAINKLNIEENTAVCGR